MQIVLTGQPELIRKLSDPALRQLRQRIAIEHHMEPLAPDEVGPYVAHRLKVAGASFEQIFEPGVDQVFHWFSDGCPRLISLLADRVLLAGFSRQMHRITREFVEEKAKAMGASRTTGFTGSLGFEGR